MIVLPTFRIASSLCRCIQCRHQQISFKAKFEIYHKMLYLKLTKHPYTMKLTSTFLVLLFLLTSNIIFGRDDSGFQKKIEAAAGDSLKLIEAHYEYGCYLDDESITDGSVKHLKIALRIAGNTNNHVEKAKVANYLAGMYWMTGDFDGSVEMYKLGLQSAEKTGDSKEIAKISMNLANDYNYFGDYENAIKYALYALKIKESANNLNRICYDYVSMGSIFRENGNNKKWEEYVLKAYKMKDEEGCASTDDIAKIYNSLGSIAEENDEFDKALLYYDTVMTVSKEADYYKGINVALCNSASVYKKTGDYDKALELSNEAESYFDDNPYDKIYSNNFKAELYKLQGEYNKGLQLANENIKYEDIQYYSSEKSKCLQLLSELNYNLSNYREAFLWNDSLRGYENKLRDEDVRRSFEELETKYETEKKEQQIELLTAENRLKNQRFIVAFASAGVFFIVILLILYILRIRKKQAALAQTDLQQQVLRAQMNPHFIFNVLGSIQNYIQKNDNRNASNFLSQFASLTRSTLNYSAAETISLSNEIGMLKNYMELERMRMTDAFDFEINYNDDLEVDFIDIPPMLVQPFIENSIKHGFKNLDRKGLLKVTVVDKIERVEFVIEDNGNGIREKKETRNGHSSMAMKIFEKRKKLIEQKYNTNFGFDIQNSKEIEDMNVGVRITLNIPVLNED